MNGMAGQFSLASKPARFCHSYLSTPFPLCFTAAVLFSLLSPHTTSVYNISSLSVRKNLLIPSQIKPYGQGNQRTKVSSSISDLPLLNFLQECRSFPPSVSISYSQWITSFMTDHVLPMNYPGSERSMSKIMLQDYVDSVEMFLEDYFRGILDQTEFKTRTEQIVDDLFHCMEDYLSHSGIKRGLDSEESSAGISGFVGMNIQEGWVTKLSLEDWEYAWKQPFRGKSLIFLKQKLALNVDALRRAERPSMNKISKLEMSRIIPII